MPLSYNSRRAKFMLLTSGAIRIGKYKQGDEYNEIFLSPRDNGKINILNIDFQNVCDDFIKHKPVSDIVVAFSTENSIFLEIKGRRTGWLICDASDNSDKKKLYEVLGHLDLKKHIIFDCLELDSSGNETAYAYVIDKCTGEVKEKNIGSYNDIPGSKLERY